ncbi:MAG: hypothetical protein ACOVOD_10010, partial [Rhodoferax sp.]
MRPLDGLRFICGVVEGDDGTLVLGAEQHMFGYEDESDKPAQRHGQVSGADGQVWNLNLLDNK